MATVKHGHRGGTNGQRSRTYNSWRAMHERCARESHPRYPDYGGRGVQVSPRWTGIQGFVNFLADMGERPEGMTLDRIDVDGHYVPENCRWLSLIGQRWNRRDMAVRDADVPPEFHVTPLFIVSPEKENNNGADEWPF